MKKIKRKSKDNQSLKKDINKIVELKETNKNKETIGERVIKLTNEISSLEKQLDESENRNNYLEKENNELKNQLQNFKDNEDNYKKKKEEEDEDESQGSRAGRADEARGVHRMRVLRADVPRLRNQGREVRL